MKDLLYKPVITTEEIMESTSTDIDSWLNKWKENERRLMECDDMARERGTLKGRIIKHPYADGYAIYQVIKENKKTVRIRICTGLGDDWVLPAWGSGCSINKGVALNFIRHEDFLREAFSG